MGLNIVMTSETLEQTCTSLFIDASLYQHSGCELLGKWPPTSGGSGKSGTNLSSEYRRHEKDINNDG